MNEYSDLNSRFHVQVLDSDGRERYSQFVDKVTHTELAELSKEYPGCTVFASRWARHRMIVQDGEITKDYPDLNHFYLPRNTDEWRQMCEEWTKMYRFTTGSEDA